MSPVLQVAATLPEPRSQSVKKRVRPISSATPSPAVSIATVAATPVPASVEREVVKTKEEAKKKVEGKEKKRSFDLISAWPVGVGLFLSGYVVQWQTMASQIGVWGMRLAFPLTLLATHREIGIDNQMAALLPQIALYSQLPLEGALMTVMLARGKTLTASIAQLILIHLVATLVLWLLSFSGA